MKLKPHRSRAHVACALAAWGSSALLALALAGGVLASPAAASAGRARVPKPAQRPAGRLANRSAHRPQVLNPAQLPAVRLPNRWVHRARRPKFAHRPADRLPNRSAHAANAYGNFNLETLNSTYFWNTTAGALVVAVSQGSTSPGTPVIQWWDNGDGAAEQFWSSQPAMPWLAYGYGYGGPSPDYIINQNSGQCLTSDGVAGDETYQWPCVGSPYQMWYPNNDTTVIIPTGINNLFSSEDVNTWQNAASGLYLDVTGDNPLPGAYIDTWYYNGAANQYFHTNY
jgi:hypothetical protein